METAAIDEQPPDHRQDADDDPVPSLSSWQALQTQEWRLVLLIGATTGISIGVFFLIYIVVAIVLGEGTNFSPGT